MQHDFSKAIHREWRKQARWLREQDSQMAPIIDAVGWPKLSLTADPFQALSESILSQQLAGRAAQCIIERFAALEPPFPKPISIVRWKPEKLRAVGISASKASYLKALATAWSDRKWRSGWADLEDDELIARLVEVRGVGVWTAHMFLIFSLGRHNILPIGDYGVRRGVQLLLQMKEVPAPKLMESLVPHWKGAYSVASWYLWRALDRKLLA